MSASVTELAAGPSDLAVGTPVRRKDNGLIGVVVNAVPDSQALVAFGTQLLSLHPGDLEPLLGTPEQRLADGQLGESEAHCLRIQAAFLEHAYRYDRRASLTNSRIEPQPHQVFIADRVTRKLRPRMLLADEVGLGKTIEAGLIIKELRARGQAQRVLVVCPASLARQWQTELASKFNENFSIIDGLAAKHLERTHPNPFTAVETVICSLAFAARAPRAEQIVDAGWDLVVFDEAHRVRRTKSRSTQAYDLADELKEHTDGLLLLSATPMQLDPYELYSLVQLVEPGIFRTPKEFEEQRAATPRLNDMIRALDGWRALSSDQQAHAFRLHADRLAAVRVTSPEQLHDDARREQAIGGLAAWHPLADVVVRNRKAELGMSGRRRARIREVHLSEEERDVHEAVSTYLREGYRSAQGDPALGFLMVNYQKLLTSSSQALRSSLKRRQERLREAAAARRAARAAKVEIDDDPEELSAALEEVEGLARPFAETELVYVDDLVERLGGLRDSKAFALVELVDEIRAEQPDAKLVVFTQFIETQRFLATLLKQNGYQVSEFNGRMSLDEKELAVRRFRETADVLLSTEAGGEGRNLQFANHLVNYDLPWNPMKVEQRIGRLDRIGQQRTVEIHNLVSVGTLEERILEVLHTRIRLFQESVGALDPILGRVERELERIVFSEHPEVEFVRYGESLEGQVNSQRLAEEKLADFALDRSSLRRDVANQLLETPPLASQDDVERFVARALDHLGGRLLEGDSGETALKLPTRAAARLARQASYRGTFDTATALRREDLQFFAFGHEIVDGLVAYAGGLDDGVVGARRDPTVPSGTWVEVVWRICGDAGRPTGRLLRHLVGADLSVTSTELRRVPLGEPAGPVAVPEWVPAAVEASRRVAQDEFAELRTELAEEMERTRTERLRQAERLHQYKQERLLSRIEAEEAWLAEQEAQPGSSRSRKILPARRAKLAKDRERLAQLAEEYEVERERIAAQALVLAFEVLWASLVVAP